MYTFVLWNNPAWFFSETTCILVVGFWLRRRPSKFFNLVLPTAVYWGIIGNLIVAGYFFAADSPSHITSVIVLKNFVNILTAAMTANIMAVAIRFRPNSDLKNQPTVPIRLLLFNVFGTLMLFAATTLMLVDVKQVAKRSELEIEARIQRVTAGILSHLADWLEVRHQGVKQMAIIAAEHWPAPQEELQPFLEAIDLSISDTGGMYIADETATAIAFSPLINERGEKTVGTSFADRPYVAEMKETHLPVVTDLIFERGIFFKPIIVMTAPIIFKDKYVGYAAGGIDFERIEVFLASHTKNSSLFAIVLDSKNNVIASNNSNLATTDNFTEKRKGLVEPLGDQSYRWYPGEKHGSNVSRWRDSWLGLKTDIPARPGWQLVVEDPIAPYHKDILIRLSSGFLLLLALLCLLLGISYILTGWFVRPLTSLVRATRDLPSKIFENKSISLPQTIVSEIRELSDNFLKTGELLKGQVDEIYRSKLAIEQHHLELAAAKTKAEEANAAKSQFLANVSHEIRTPLGVVLGFADILARDVHSLTSRRYIDTIIRNGRQLLRLVDDLLDLTKIEKGRLLIEEMSFNLTQLSEEVLASYSVKAKEKNLKLSMKTDGHLPKFILSDPTRVRQVLENLIGNSIKFTEAGFIDMTLAAELQSNQFWILKFTIKDSGIGMTESESGRIFESFVQADPSTSRRFGGTGLGLSLARKLANQLGGSIDLLQTAPNQGSTFSFFFTACEDTDGHHDIVETNNLPMGHPLSGLRVLVVEDNPDSQTMIETVLRNAGALVETAEDGHSGVEKALGSHFDCVLMDIQLPGLNGYDAARNIRAAGSLTPIIALSAHTMSDEQPRSKKAGCNDYISKPFKHEVLVEKILALRK